MRIKKMVNFNKIIKVALVRGKYLNNFEGQNFVFDKRKIKLTGICSLKPQNEKFPFSIIHLPSIFDFSFNPFLEKILKWTSNRLIGDAQILFGLEKYKSEFDIFDTADPHYFYSYQLAKLKQKKLIKKLIVTYWETIPFNNESTKNKKIIKYFTLKQADFLITHTCKSKKALIKEGQEEKKIKIIKLGVDLNRFKPKKKKKDSYLKILFVGRLVEEKGILDLYSVFKEILNKIKTVKLKLLIVGEGVLKKRLIKMIKNDRLENFIFLTASDYNNIHRIYQSSDLLVVPSKSTKTWEEQYGMVLVEGMASGLPIVAYNSGAISEVLGQQGILIKEGNKNLLFKSLIRLIEKDDLRKKMGYLGRIAAKKYYDAKKIAYQFQDFYLKILR